MSLRKCLLMLMVSLFVSSSVLSQSRVRESATPEADVYLQLIQRMQQEGAWFASLAHISAHRQQHGSTPALQLAEADALRQIGQIEQAKSLYQTLTRTHLKAAGQHGLGLLHASQQQLPQALEHLQAATLLSPLETRYLSDYGYALLLAGQQDAARLPLAQAAELSPKDGTVIANLAIWQLMENRLGDAERLMELAQLPEATRQSVRTTAQALRLKQPTRSTTSVRAIGMSTQSLPPSERHPGVSTAPSQQAPAATGALRLVPPVQLPAHSAHTPLLEKFSSPPAPNGGQP